MAITIIDAARRRAFWAVGCAVAALSTACAASAAPDASNGAPAPQVTVGDKTTKADDKNKNTDGVPWPSNQRITDGDSQTSADGKGRKPYFVEKKCYPKTDGGRGIFKESPSAYKNGDPRLLTVETAALNSIRPDEGPDLFGKVDCQAQYLEGLFAARSGREQQNIQFGTNTTILGSLGYILSAKAGVDTQHIWSSLAYGPVLLTNFQANEPTRDIFYAGDISLSFIRFQYLRANNLIKVVADTADGSVTTESAKASLGTKDLTGACNELNSAWDEANKNPGGDAKYLGTLKSSVKTYQDKCTSIKSSIEQYVSYIYYVGAVKRQELALNYLQDVSRLNNSIANQSRMLKTSPIKALTGIVASPLIIAGSIISNDNYRTALVTVQTQVSVNNLDLAYQGVALAPPPARLELLDMPPARKAEEDSKAGAKGQPKGGGANGGGAVDAGGAGSPADAVVPAPGNETPSDKVDRTMNAVYTSFNKTANIYNSWYDRLIELKMAAAPGAVNIAVDTATRNMTVKFVPAASAADGANPGSTKGR